ncbi:MAG: domain protein beta Propeller [Acidimicrobiales bacterium]|nr:domain protein beta Propeller [Acidimicrobiales bacterium]
MSSIPPRSIRRTRRHLTLVAGVAVALSVVTACDPAPAPGTTALESKPTAGGTADGDSTNTRVSDDGTTVVFDSYATNLLAAPSSGYQVYARRTDGVGGSTIEMVSRSTRGFAGNDGSRVLAVSSSGRYVVFDSYATNLVEGDTNGHIDVFLRDRTLQTTERVNISSTEQQAVGTNAQANRYAADVTPDGRYVVFSDDANNLDPIAPVFTPNIYRRDRVAGTTMIVSVTPAKKAASGKDPQMSDNGNVVAFTSEATNLGPVDQNGKADIFTRDIAAGTTQLMSRSVAATTGNGKSLAPSISGDGNSVAFLSEATNLINGDTNGKQDAFVTDRTQGSRKRVSLSSTGQQLNQHTVGARLSANGAVLVFGTTSSGVVPGQAACYCAYRRGILAGGEKTSVAVITSGGSTVLTLRSPLGESLDLSATGRIVAFVAKDKVTATDTNGLLDVFTRRRP